jgi:effector-binding domain-containing protein
MPVREIRDLLGTSDPDERAELIAHHLARLEGQLEQTRAAVASLRRLLETPAPLEVERRTVAARVVAAVSARVALGDILGWYSGAMDEIDSALDTAGARPNGPRGGVYDNELFTDEIGPALVYVPTARPPSSGRVQPVELPAGELILTVHCGPHDDIDVTYGALGAWVDANGLMIAGPVHEIYLVGPGDTADSTAWRTEIGWPILAVLDGRITASE